MFWRKTKQGLETLRPDATSSERAPLSRVDRFNEAAATLAASLDTYADAAFCASREAPDKDLVEARAKVEAARKLVTEGRLAYALGRCLPGHVEHWPAWINRDDFRKWVHFDAQSIAAYEHEEQDGSRNAKVVTIDFIFNGRQYRFVLRDRGMSYAPDRSDKIGEVELWHNDFLVAKFEVIEDLLKEYSEWEFSDVLALRVGQWMQDVLDIAAQIEAGRHRSLGRFTDERTVEAAKNIDLG